VKRLFSRKFLRIILFTGVAISLIQSPAAEAGRIFGAGYEFMIIAAVSGIIIDILFTAEFIVKGIKSRGENGFNLYFFKRDGWIDFLNSVVMLIIVSVPLLVITFSQRSDGGILHLFLIIYGISPALRILRILKLSSILGGGIPGMASRHTAFIANSAVLVLFAAAFMSQLPGYGNSSGILLIYFCAIILVLIFRILYRRHFERTVSHVIKVIDLGLRRRNYNIQVRINDKYGDDEVYRLASYYNSVFLPSKMKQILDDKRIRGNVSAKQRSREE
jgi:hypothetical protein